MKLISSYLVYKTSEFGITKKRVLMKLGFFQRTTLEMFLNKIEGIKIHQSFLGRMLDFGSIEVIGTGGTKNLFSNLSSPLEFKRNIEKQLYILQDK